MAGRGPWARCSPGESGPGGESRARRWPGLSSRWIAEGRGLVGKRGYGADWISEAEGVPGAAKGAGAGSRLGAMTSPGWLVDGGSGAGAGEVEAHRGSSRQ